MKMSLTFEHQGQSFVAVDDAFHSIGIELDFDGPQPNHFGASKAKRKPLQLGGFVGRTAIGGSCNVDVVELVPHCNGTHTETVGHIVDDEIWIGHATTRPFVLAVLITVQPVRSAQVTETYRPPLEAVDRVVLGSQIGQAVARFAELKPDALIIRTLPNDPVKKSRAYTEQNQPAFLTVEAMQAIVKLGVRHLLVDLPSVDRMYDDGLLTNHHLFWNVKEESHSITEQTWQDKTITEMVFVDDQLGDGLYGLSLQFPAFSSDAAPSRPIVWKVASQKLKNEN